jgi:hypothetical protein
VRSPLLLSRSCPQSLSHSSFRKREVGCLVNVVQASRSCLVGIGLPQQLAFKLATGMQPAAGACLTQAVARGESFKAVPPNYSFKPNLLRSSKNHGKKSLPCFCFHYAGRLNSGVRGQMNRQDVFAAFTSLALALALAYGLDAYTTPHDLTETNPSAVALFSGWLMAITTNLAPPIVLGALARRKVILSACLLAIATVAAHTYFSVHRMYYPNILGELFEHIIQYIFMALGALYLKQGLSSNNSFKPNPLRSFKTPSGFSGGSA